MSQVQGEAKIAALKLIVVWFSLVYTFAVNNEVGTKVNANTEEIFLIVMILTPNLKSIWFGWF